MIISTAVKWICFNTFINRKMPVHGMQIRCTGVFLMQLPGLIFCNKTFYPVIRVEQMADRRIVVQCVNDIRDIFTHVTVDIIRLA